MKLKNPTVETRPRTEKEREEGRGLKKTRKVLEKRNIITPFYYRNTGFGRIQLKGFI